MLIAEISPVNSASTSVACGSTVYLPRPMNSERTFWVRSVSMLKTVVRLANVGTPIVLILAGRKEPRPARAYPHPGEPATHRTPRTPRPTPAAGRLRNTILLLLPRRAPLLNNDADQRSLRHQHFQNR